MSRALIVMGVSGSGKTRLGQALGQSLGWRFIEGDSLHPASNRAKMAAGEPLDDSDRRPFLQAVAEALVTARADMQCAGIVLSCSALKRSYRDLIRARAGEVIFVLPAVNREQLAARLAQRTGHFMPAALLDSQLADFEPPAADEQVIEVDGAAATAAQVAAVRAALAARPDAG
jgi:carbohydrate kinase (thermoresistant glucokinase family)